MRGRLAIVVCALIGACSMPQAARPDSRLALFEVTAVAHLTAERSRMAFDLSGLDHGEAAERVQIAIPAAYRLTLGRRLGSILGDAAIDIAETGQPDAVDYNGSLRVASSADGDGCTAGAHLATWSLDVSGPERSRFKVPVVVDRADRGELLTVCLAQLRSAGELTHLYFAVSGVFRNPSTTGTYLFDANVTPFAGRDYELRAYELVPQLLSATATYDPRRELFRAHGRLVADGQPRVGIRVHVYAGITDQSWLFRQVGVAVTNLDGDWTFSKRISDDVTFMMAKVWENYDRPCKPPASAPGGCRTYTIDGRSSAVTKVTPGTTR